MHPALREDLVRVMCSERMRVRSRLLTQFAGDTARPAASARLGRWVGWRLITAGQRLAHVTVTRAAG